MSKVFSREFETYDLAFDCMKRKNKAEKQRKSSDAFCVVPGPNDNFCVVDSLTAVELGIGYVYSSEGYISNPFNN